MFGYHVSNLTSVCNLYPLEVVGRVSETRLHMVEKLFFLIFAVVGYFKNVVIEIFHINFSTAIFVIEEEMRHGHRAT